MLSLLPFSLFFIIKQIKQWDGFLLEACITGFLLFCVICHFIFLIYFASIYIEYHFLFFCTRWPGYKNKPNKYTDQISYAYEAKGWFRFKRWERCYFEPRFEEKVLNPQLYASFPNYLASFYLNFTFQGCWKSFGW